MRHREASGGVLAPCAYRGCQVFLEIFAEEIPLGIAAEKQRQPDLRQQFQDASVPMFGTFPSRRQIAPARVLAGITEAHRHNRNPRFIIERFTIKLHPASEPVAAGIVPGDACFVHSGTRRLAHDENLRRGAGAKRGPGTEWQFGLADAAQPNLIQEPRELFLRVQGRDPTL